MSCLNGYELYPKNVGLLSIFRIDFQRVCSFSSALTYLSGRAYELFVMDEKLTGETVRKADKIAVMEGGVSKLICEEEVES